MKKSKRESLPLLRREPPVTDEPANSPESRRLGEFLTGFSQSGWRRSVPEDLYDAHRGRPSTASCASSTTDPSCPRPSTRWGSTRTRTSWARCKSSQRKPLSTSPPRSTRAPPARFRHDTRSNALRLFFWDGKTHASRRTNPFPHEILTLPLGVGGVGQGRGGVDRHVRVQTRPRPSRHHRERRGARYVYTRRKKGATL